MILKFLRNLSTTGGKKRKGQGEPKCHSRQRGAVPPAPPRRVELLAANKEATTSVANYSSQFPSILSGSFHQKNPPLLSPPVTLHLLSCLTLSSSLIPFLWSPPPLTSPSLPLPPLPRPLSHLSLPSRCDSDTLRETVLCSINAHAREHLFPAMRARGGGGGIMPVNSIALAVSVVCDAGNKHGVRGPSGHFGSKR